MINLKDKAVKESLRISRYNIKKSANKANELSRSLYNAQNNILRMRFHGYLNVADSLGKFKGNSRLADITNELSIAINSIK